MRTTMNRFYITLFTVFSLILFLLPAGFIALSLSEQKVDQSFGATQPLFIQLTASTVIFEEEGIASWYGPGFHGNMTANGERYNMYSMTAAHRTLPFGTIVRIENLQNGKSTLVRINDRGPYISKRNIDLTYTAARRYLGITGIAPTRVKVFYPLSPTIISENPPPPGAVLITFNSDYQPIIPTSPLQTLYTSRNFTKTMLKWQELEDEGNSPVFLQISMPTDSLSYAQTIRWNSHSKATPIFVYKLVTHSQPSLSESATDKVAN